MICYVCFQLYNFIPISTLCPGLNPDCSRAFRGSRAKKWFLERLFPQRGQSEPKKVPVKFGKRLLPVVPIRTKILKFRRISQDPGIYPNKGVSKCLIPVKNLSNSCWTLFGVFCPEWLWPPTFQNFWTGQGPSFFELVRTSDPWSLPQDRFSSGLLVRIFVKITQLSFFNACWDGTTILYVVYVTPLATASLLK